MEITKEELQEIIEQAFMAGQFDCGVDPSFSSAQAYGINIIDRLTTPTERG